MNLSVFKAKLLINLVFLAVTVVNVNTQNDSPCANVLRYNKFEVGKWSGTIQIKPTEPLYGIWLKIVFGGTIDTLINNFGETTTIDKKEYIIKNRYKVVMRHDDPVTVDFRAEYDPNSESIPYVREIRVNGRDVCERATSVVAPPPPTTEPSTPKPSTASALFTVLTPMHREPTLCGVTAIRAKPLITHGELTAAGEWPWHVAIYDVSAQPAIYICGGSLVSFNHVVTAGHCVTVAGTNSARDAKDYKVYMGTSSLKLMATSLQERLPSTIVVHPEFDGLTFFNDIAVIKLNGPIAYTTFVRPVCLWTGTVVPEGLGTIVGWGVDDTGTITEDLMKAEVPIKSATACLFSNRRFFSYYLNENNYCAGHGNGTSACNGDSGSGMVFRRTNSDAWQLKGIVSVGVPSSNGYLCDPKHYVVFTDVSKFTGWIDAAMRR